MIRVHQLSKRFWLYDRPGDRVLDWMLPGRRGHAHWALRDVTFEVEGGSSVGIIGANGAGKSTLLKILTGTTQPTRGSFEIRGRVASLLELGMGFHPEFTGRQNVRFGGRMAGLGEPELHDKFNEIVEFAEIGEFIDQPVRTYSTGMLLRLGFALASSVAPDVLIVDEALAVGDLHFQQKCLRRIREIHARGATILFVSHDPSLIKKFCTEAILLDRGQVLDRGTPDHVLDYYTALLAERYREGGGQAQIIRPEKRAAGPEAAALPGLEARGHRTGNFRAVITAVYFEGNGPDGSARMFATGAAGTLHVRWVALAPVATATVGIAIKDRLGQEVFGVNTALRELKLENIAEGQAVDISFRMELNLGDGLYSVTAALHEGVDHTQGCYDWIEQALAFQILPSPIDRFTGIVRLTPECAAAFETASESEQQTARGLLTDCRATQADVS